ncbi:MAG: PDZ domain-containing protein [Acidimicrobiales bacterium]
MVLVVVLGLVAALVIASTIISVPYYSLVPGDAQPVSQLITVPASRHHSVKGQILLTDVGVMNLKLIGLIPAYLDRDATVVKTADLTGDVPVSEYYAEGTVDMAESQLTAHAVALRQLGYSVPEHDAGVTIYVIEPGSPAWRTLQVGDVVSSIDGTPTTNPQALQNAIRSHRPGDVVTLRVGSIMQPTPGHDVTVRLTATMVDHKKVALLGIGDPQAPNVPSMGTQGAYDFPFPVSINSDNIGGPSAGLAFTLGILNTLTGGELTGGRTIAATGTIRPDGSVGDVGGVKQKTVAVEQAGASVFFVPDPELATARSMQTPSLKVYAVSSLGQALQDLQRLGGHLGAAAKGPVSGPGGNSVPTDWQDSPWT